MKPKTQKTRKLKRKVKPVKAWALFYADGSPMYIFGSLAHCKKLAQYQYNLIPKKCGYICIPVTITPLPE